MSENPLNLEPQRAQTPGFLLIINSGSSSIKFALFEVAAPASQSARVPGNPGAPASLPASPSQPISAGRDAGTPRVGGLERVLSGKFERVGFPDGKLHVADLRTGQREQQQLQIANHAACVGPLIALLEKRAAISSIRAIGHRVVHGGMRFFETQLVTEEMLAELRRLSPFVPDHLPSGIMLMEAISKESPNVPQVACFDTAFHRTMPRVARLLPIPRRFDAKGIQRYGFHGLSYAYLMGALERVAGEEARGRVILAHLGNGASMAAVHNGRCVDTTMAFTPAAGLVMSTRSGDLDPGLFSYLARVEGLSGEQMHRMVNEQSGLLGVSETSPDMRDLLAHESTDDRAAEAVSLFCYHARKWIGALATTLGGVDTLVFAGGIGENSPPVRERICDGLEFLGIQIEAARNEANEAVISKEGSRATVRVIRTDEELFIANSAASLLGL